MIRNRPDSHFELKYYRGLPEPPYQIDLEKIPDLVRAMLFPLRHVEPVTAASLSIMPEFIGDFPNDEEFDYYASVGSKFQLVFIVINSIFADDLGESRLLYPFSISLIPASKRGIVEESSPEFVSRMKSNSLLSKDTAYMNLDPFVGEWGFWSEISIIAGMGKSNAYTDEMGLVYDYYYLRNDADLAEVVQPAVGVEGDKLKKYLRHRAKLLYKPFTHLESRQIWGVENGLELFLLHEFVRRKLPFPTIQARVYTDGVYPTLYHAWAEWDDSQSETFISEVDFLFEEQKVVVFCDGARHRKRRIIERDKHIDERLKSAGFKVVRITSEQILNDVQLAAKMVSMYL